MKKRLAKVGQGFVSRPDFEFARTPRTLPVSWDLAKMVNEKLRPNWGDFGFLSGFGTCRGPHTHPSLLSFGKIGKLARMRKALRVGRISRNCQDRRTHTEFWRFKENRKFARLRQRFAFLARFRAIARAPTLILGVKGLASSLPFSSPSSSSPFFPLLRILFRLPLFLAGAGDPVLRLGRSPACDWSCRKKSAANVDLCGSCYLLAET